MRLSYVKLTLVLAVLAMIFIPSIHKSTAKNQPSAAIPAINADLKNEDRVIGRYFDDLVNYDRECTQVAKKQILVRADLDPLQNKSDALKGRLSEVQNAIREIVRKLKASNEWDDLDGTISRLANPRYRSFFQETSLKQVLEDSSSGLTGRSSEISEPLEGLRKRSTSRYSDSDNVQFIAAAYSVPPSMAFVSVRCSIATIKGRLVHKLGGEPTDATLHSNWDACHPGVAYPL